VLAPSIRLNFGIRISDAIQEKGRESTRESRGRVSGESRERLPWSSRTQHRVFWNGWGVIMDALHCTAARGARGELGDHRCGRGWGAENRTVWSLRYFSLGANSDGGTRGDYRRLQEPTGSRLCFGVPRCAATSVRGRSRHTAEQVPSASLTGQEHSPKPATAFGALDKAALASDRTDWRRRAEESSR
jgi:hypothetical protein